MFDIGWTEMALAALVAIIVIGPKELPGTLRALGKALGKARSLAREFRRSIDEMVREVDVTEALPTAEDLRIHPPPLNIPQPPPAKKTAKKAKTKAVQKASTKSGAKSGAKFGARPEKKGD